MMSYAEGATTMHDEVHATNSCRTCRQKRVKCDRLLPRCLRCSTLKLRCLGYERRKTLVWTNSIASRGKMMGKDTFDTIQDQKTPLAAKKNSDSLHSELVDTGLTESHPRSVTILTSLVEPGLQDLSQDCRNYIRYCELQVCRLRHDGY